MAVANELRPKMAEVYLQLHPSTAMVVGDCCCPEVIFKVWGKASSIIHHLFWFLHVNPTLGVASNLELKTKGHQLFVHH